MNRLTIRKSDGAWDVPLRNDDGAYIPSQEIIDRLAAYEDSGLAPDELEKLVAFKEYFDALYGQGLQIANWHMNGDLEPFDSFYEEAIADNEEEDPDGKNDQMEP